MYSFRTLFINPVHTEESQHQSSKKHGVTCGKVRTLSDSRLLPSLTYYLVGTVDVPLEKLPSLNKSKDHSWFFSESGGVLAGLEVFHSLHCLDMVRQYTYRNEYDYSDNPTFQDDDEFLRTVSSNTFPERIGPC